ncbi:D-alanyl-D-alanine carboxypeptidase family protein [Flexibacterium corallicola]|uniref:D-alanyl-D-alanine carboxypeptidase family protein n=1 Tax=Flexibacterium corallicola TaxID=3037259 RepID=UPI00286FA9E5|nr:D-alanyl-D-alanine carboxypeptidase family protein [Pseudovibrio sp. M1P-2-3]
MRSSWARNFFVTVLYICTKFIMMLDLAGLLKVYRGLLGLGAVVIFFLSMGHSAQAIILKSKSAILYDASADKVIYSKNSDSPFPPANLTKIMTSLAVVNALRNEEIAGQTPLRISEHAWRTGGAPARVTTMFANVRSTVSVDNLLQGLVVHSANDAAIALAEGIDGDEASFAARMSETAAGLGMLGTTYANPTGYKHKYNQTTLSDQILLARHIANEVPDLFALYGQESFKWNKILQRNKNPLRKEIKNLEGFAAGYTRDFGFSAIGTIQIGAKRYIAGVAGAPTAEDRLDDMKTLLVRAFSSLTILPIFDRGEYVGQASVYGGSSPDVPLIAKDTIAALLNTGDKKYYSLKISYQGPLTAPVKKGTEVGELQILSKNDVIYRAPLITGGDVGVGSLKQRSTDAVGELFWKIF